MKNTELTRREEIEIMVFARCHDPKDFGYDDNDWVDDGLMRELLKRRIVNHVTKIDIKRLGEESCRRSSMYERVTDILSQEEEETLRMIAESRPMILGHSFNYWSPLTLAEESARLGFVKKPLGMNVVKLVLQQREGDYLIHRPNKRRFKGRSGRVTEEVKSKVVEIYKKNTFSNDEELARVVMSSGITEYIGASTVGKIVREAGLRKKRAVWHRITDEVKDEIIEIFKNNPSLTRRELAEVAMDSEIIEYIGASTVGKIVREAKLKKKSRAAHRISDEVKAEVIGLFLNNSHLTYKELAKAVISSGVREYIGASTVRKIVREAGLRKKQGRRTSNEVKDKVIEIFKNNPSLTGKQLAKAVIDSGVIERISSTTVLTIVREAGLRKGNSASPLTESKPAQKAMGLEISNEVPNVEKTSNTEEGVIVRERRTSSTTVKHLLSSPFQILFSQYFKAMHHR